MPLHSAFQTQLTNFRALIEHSSDVIIISDAGGIERYVSPSVRRVLGYEPEEMLARSQYLLHHPEDRDRVRKTFFDFVESKDKTPIVFSWRFLHKNGSWRWIEATASNQLDNPLINGIILNFRDITQAKEQAAEIQRQAARFQAMMENIEDQIQIYATDGRLLYTNRRDLISDLAPELLTEKQGDLLWWIHPEERPQMIDLFHKLATGELMQVLAEYRIVDLQGKMRWVETFATSQVNNEAVGGILANVRDITRRKQLEEALRAAKEKAEADAREIERSNLEIRLKNRELKKLNEEKNELLQIVSHDLKNPLYNLQHEALAILDNPENVRPHVLRVLSCADKMLSLITNFLSIHTIESGKLEIRSERVSMPEQVSRVLQFYGERMRHKQLSVTTAWPEGSLDVRADANAVHQILDNLISNAIKYSPPGGTIQIELVAGPDALITRIQDQGAGVPLDEADRLFRKFTRLSPKPTAGESSNGLGLAITKKLVHLLQGEIWYEHHPGAGATFAFELPAWNK
ncbi:sensor histidine kinase [Tellurirhabdus rosea]|uniref:sensor histidine kinase n=1 Tax=Tellurirhabdus rosea TaxID=2674997 RepID=UPI00224EDF39|nr:PAS domain-containing sensor histidine kinase [Tellurirhabdus rosea]